MTDRTSHRKKKKRGASGNASGNASGMKKLRQKTLLGFTASEASPSLTRPHISSTVSPKKLNSPRKTKRRHVSDSSGLSDVTTIRLEPAAPTPKPEEGGDRSESPMPSHAKRRRMFVVESGSDEEETQSSSSEVVSVPRRRRLRRHVLAASESSEQSSHSVDERKHQELVSEDDLSNEVDKHCIIESRLRIRDKKTAFQRNLERFKRKKLGKSMSSSDFSNEGSENPSEEEQLKPFKGAKLAGSDVESLTGNESDSDDSLGFIVEDDNQAVAAQLPTEFSMQSHDDLSHQFKIIFQLFVHVAVRPSVERQIFMSEQVKAQDYFAFPLRTTRRKLLGLRDSLVASSIWRPKFRKALDKYPTFECVPLDISVPFCDACHLNGRLSTLLGRLGGVSYNKIGFTNNIASDSEEDNSENSVTRLKKSQFGFLEFHLGRFCARRVHIYHALSHWEYHLFDTIRSEVDNLHAVKEEHGYVRVAFVGGKQPPSDLTDADGICEWLDERGIIDQEWYKMKTMMDSAHNLESSAKEGQ